MRRKSAAYMRLAVLAFTILMAVLVFFFVIYKLTGFALSAHGMVLLLSADFLILFVLYRNTFQFRGFYTGRSKERLSHQLTLTLSALSAILILFALFVK
ncbi:MAG: hypothetical protein ABF868_02635 [Sporolactobacillus sp.]